MLHCFHSLTSIQTVGGGGGGGGIPDSVSGQLCRDKECPFNGVTNSGRVWRKVLESDAQSEPVSRNWGQGHRKILSALPQPEFPLCKVRQFSHLL